MPVRFFEENVNVKLNKKKALKSYIIGQANHYLNLKSIDISYVFCDDEALLQRNIDFLNHNTYTDILTFDLSDDEDHLIAEIYISIDRVKDNAKQYETTYKEELHRVIFHGLLHLIGFDDTSEKKKKIMRQKENELILAYYRSL